MLEKNKIYHMDALYGLKLLDENSIDACIIDPPYFIEKLKVNLRSQSLRTPSKSSVFFAEWDAHFEDLNTYIVFINRFLVELKRVLKPKAQVYMFFSYHHINRAINLIKLLKYRYYKPIIWYKPDTMGLFPNQYGCNYEMILWFRNDMKSDKDRVKLNIGCSQRDVFVHNSTNIKYRKECGFHPTCKPISIIRQLVKNCTNEGDLVVDAFVGSGTTAVACKQTNRNFIGFDLDRGYIKTANRRLSQVSLKNWFTTE